MISMLHTFLVESRFSCRLQFQYNIYFFSDRNYDHVLQVRFAELQDKLEMSDTLNRERQDNLNKLRNQFNYFLQMVSQNSTVNR